MTALKNQILGWQRHPVPMQCSTFQGKAIQALDLYEMQTIGFQEAERAMATTHGVGEARKEPLTVFLYN